MVIKIQYCQHMRKDGTYNTVIFDTNKKVFSTSESKFESKYKTKDWSKRCFVEAYKSSDVNDVVSALRADGFAELFGKDDK